MNYEKFLSYSLKKERFHHTLERQSLKIIRINEEPKSNAKNKMTTIKTLDRREHLAI